MEGRSAKNALPKYVTVVVFALLSICAILAFGYYAVDVILDLILRRDVIAFNKGAMYMLGVGAGLGLLVIFMVWELSGKTMSSSGNKKATQLALASLVLMVVLPQAADYLISRSLGSSNYVYCERESYRWLHAQSKVYTSSARVCKNLHFK